MKNIYEVTLRVETDEDGLISLKVVKMREVVEEDKDNPDE